ncbi:MAG: putative Ig domain-containing protein, partial [Hyphomicrobiaceae bacterium]
ASVIGAFAEKYLGPDYTVEATTANNDALPSWLSFDAASMTFSGSWPTGETAPYEVAIFVKDPANGAVYAHRLAFIEKDFITPGALDVSSVMDQYLVRQPFHITEAFNAAAVDAASSVTATLADGTALPSWLTFDATSLVVTGTPPADVTTAFEVRLTFARSLAGASAPVTFVDTIVIDPATLPVGGVQYQSHVALFDISHGAFSASLASGRPLPDWLAFDAATRTISLSGFEPDADAPIARLQIKFTPDAVALAEGVYASSKSGFALEFVLQPGAPIDPAINAILAGNAYFASQGLFALELDHAASITATRESGAPIASWLTFDAETLSFSGLPPSEFVGTVPVRLDITGDGAGLPTMSLIQGVA